MKAEILKVKGTWRDVADSARTTIGKDAGEGEPSSLWKRRMLLCEHSPIRQLTVKAKWHGIKRWVSDHFVRHWLGVIHWVKTDRTDRTGIDRDQLLQSNPTVHEFEANAQAIINISRKRLCNCASKETRAAWLEFLVAIEDREPELYAVSQPECIYRGFCPEYKSCGYHKTSNYKENLVKYREGINPIS